MKKLFTVLTTGLLVISLTHPSGVLAAARNCDNNAVIYCGALTKSELVKKLRDGDGRHSGTSLTHLFSSRGISVTQIKSSHTVNGTVGRDGTIKVGSKTVATGARSEGRQNIPGSKKDGSLFIRPTSVSFQSDELDAFVYMKGDVFQWAIIKSCGNMVKAKPVAKSKTKIITKVITREKEVIKEVPVVQTVEVEKIVEVPKATLPQTGVEVPLAGILGISMGGAAYVRSRQELYHLLKKRGSR